MKRIAYYGGSFDPVHRGHLASGAALIGQFELDEFVYIPAFHAPHKVRLKPTSAYDRYAMLCLATQDEKKQTVSRIEIEMPERPFTVETLARINNERHDDQSFFVMGADSWMDIRTWRDWETVLTMANHIVVTRPGVDVTTNHVTEQIRGSIVDLRGSNETVHSSDERRRIYLTDAVNLDISGTEIRRKVRDGDASWGDDVTPEVANYIEKYQIYK